MNLPDWNILKQSTPAGWSFVYDPEWNDLEIRVIGTTVTTMVNGITYVDNWDGDGVLNDQLHKNKKVGEKGFIALQAHSDQQVKIFYKDIYIQDLTNGQTKTAVPAPAKTPRLNLRTSSVEAYSINGTKTRTSKNDLRPGLYILKKGDVSQLKAVVR